MNFLNIFENDFKAIFPEMFLVIAILSLLTFGVIYSTATSYNRPIILNTISWLCIQSIVLTILLIVNNPLSSIVIFKGLLIVDNLTSFIKIVILLSCLACILISLDYLKHEKINAFEYTVLILLATLGMILMVSSYDFLSFYLALELQSLSLYVLAAFQRNSEFSTEAGLKYFVLGAFASGILLFGCSMIYGFTGTTNFGELAKLLTGITNTEIISSNGILIGIIFITAALLFKLAAVPFHMWAPDVYEGAPTSVTAFFAIVPKIAIFGVALRLFFYTFYDFIEQWQQIIIMCSIASMIVAALGALYQKKIKRLLAYSAIGHVGYLLIALATGTTLGIQGLLLYMVIYIIMTTAAFTLILSLRKQGDFSDSPREAQIKYITDLTSLSKTNPVLAISFAIVLFSMAGIPPLAGFYSKLYVFFAAMDSNMYMLALVGVLTSVIGCVYYIRLIKIMYFETTPKWTAFEQMDKEKAIITASACFFIVFFFIHPTPIFIATHKAALTLCL